MVAGIEGLADDIAVQLAGLVQAVDHIDGRFHIEEILAAVGNLFAAALAADALLDDGLDVGQGFGIKVGPVLKHLQQVIGQKKGQLRRRAVGQFRPPDHGRMPQVDVRSAFD